MTELVLYRTAIAPEWIDYNGHLRDAYYGLIVSLAADALMDRLGMNAAYREATRCTLYTLEMHIHFLHELKQPDAVDVVVRVLASDRKRIHAAFDLKCGRYLEPAASAEVMLLHVQQGGKPEAAPFPAEIARALAELCASTSGSAASVPGSRRMALRSRS
jgi:acyl-CoA thioester hydrolase